MAKRGMLMTVGTGVRNRESLIQALIKSIRDADPIRVVLIHSVGSQPIAEEIAERLEGHPPSEFLRLANEENINRIFGEITDLLERLAVEWECGRENLILDYTSGTKAMSAGAVLAAASGSIGSLRYIGGERAEGIVEQGLEEIKNQTLTRWSAQENIKLAVRFLRELRFDAALAVLETISSPALTSVFQPVAGSFFKLVQGYQAWDLFDHPAAYERLRKLDCSEFPPLLQPYMIDADRIKRLNILAKRAKIAANKPSRIPVEAMADMYNNACRRLKEGKYDDAAARFYRLVEMCGQYALQQRGIFSGRVRRDQIPEASRRTYKIDPDTQTAKLGLQESYRLLRELNDPIGLAVTDRGHVGKTLTTRNLSILAHGFKPVTYQECLEFKALVELLVQIMDDQFKTETAQCARELQFPWLIPA